MSKSLFDTSIEIILNNQHGSGAYVACPNFGTYKYCWLRDGSFIAYSMDLSGHSDSSAKFFSWVDNAVSRQSEKVKRLIESSVRKEPLLNSDFLPTRYTLEGEETGDEWPNFQLDGYGTWLWALDQHIKLTGDSTLIEKYQKSIQTSIDYLLEFWDTPNFDCWEENGDKIHPSTLACIYGGLDAMAAYVQDTRIPEVTDKIRQFVAENCIKDGRLTKYQGSQSIDSSLLWVAVPFGLLEKDDTLMKNTADEIENTLQHGGGVHRYPEDTYYGGGEWVLLSCWYGWYCIETGRAEKAEEMLHWAEAHANEKGEMPEQVLEHVNNEEYIVKWKELWGEPAVPLLWSHAMYLVLACNVSGASMKMGQKGKPASMQVKQGSDW